MNNTVSGQISLPLDSDPYAENPKLSKESSDRLHNQLIRLGDMMGDGLHHEKDGAWISKEYKAVMKKLYPGIYKQKAQAGRLAIDERMAVLVAENKCPCGGTLKQTRSGAWRVDCTSCGRKMKFATRKKKR